MPGSGRAAPQAGKAGALPRQHGHYHAVAADDAAEVEPGAAAGVLNTQRQIVACSGNEAIKLLIGKRTRARAGSRPRVWNNTKQPHPRAAVGVLCLREARVRNLEGNPSGATSSAARNRGCSEESGAGVRRSAWPRRAGALSPRGRSGRKHTCFKVGVDGCELTLFPERGRSSKGPDDVARERSLYATYVLEVRLAGCGPRITTSLIGGPVRNGRSRCRAT